MARLFALLLILTFLCSDLAAQYDEHVYGIRTAVGIVNPRKQSVFVGDEGDFVTHEVAFITATPSLSLGGFHQSKIGWLYVQTELMYNSYNFDFDVNYFENNILTTTKVREKYRYINGQVTAGVHTENVRLGVGPIFHYVVGHEADFSVIESFSNKLRRLNTGMVASIGYDFEMINVDFRYERALKTIGDHLYWGPSKSRFQSRPDQISLAIGIKLGKIIW